jgi:hypothetical protein
VTIDGGEPVGPPLGVGLPVALPPDVGLSVGDPEPPFPQAAARRAIMRIRAIVRSLADIGPPGTAPGLHLKRRTVRGRRWGPTSPNRDVRSAASMRIP